MNENTKKFDFELLTDKEVEAQYKISRATQKTWRWKKNGFPYIKVGRLVRYRRADIEQWLSSSNRNAG